jgi:hypothetical protein|tara:strand:+ start:60 stop:683 length:624 start_codon:yes stop_codon:yes gene_type:complete
MAKKLGKIEKPSAEEFKKGRKLYFVPLLYYGKESPTEYQEKFNKYWGQVENQMSDLKLKLGKVNKIYHELVPVGGEDGIKVIKELNNKSYQIIKDGLDKDAQLEATEDSNLLTEFMDWSRCLVVGLQNRKVFTKVSESYTEASKNRNEHIARQIDETLKADEIGVLFMREGHQVQFPSDIQVFYVAPPALDEIRRWLRDRETKPQAD